MKWIKTNREVSVSKGTTITYRLEGTVYTVESRKRWIPHSNREGAWLHTSYFVLRDGEELSEKNTLRAAKLYAEELYNK